MLNAFKDLLCSKLCWHDRPEPRPNVLAQCSIRVYRSFSLLSGSVKQGLFMITTAIN